MGNGFFTRGLSGQGVALTTYPNLAPRLKEEYGYTSFPPLGELGERLFPFDPAENSV